MFLLYCEKLWSKSKSHVLLLLKIRVFSENSFLKPLSNLLNVKMYVIIYYI